ncbi:uncharacterized protein N7473_005006 [Penicillium subrubescens]|uniref:uncharacterized protein n=1 Tax=Penicillium subrubescens TaxID=1316194 RepID=UPI002544D6BC|nr:uncharacterized protein N7473_005006 [Penicillium subrubescens]KAJ5900936.1 hypothetical protein N7473_005006 [Penicillium subrubescens]
MKVTAPILPFIASATASCLHGTSLLPRSADGLVEINSFNYTNTGGPLTWYGLSEKNFACSKGKHQSPIDIVTEDIDYAAANSIRFNVPSADNAKFENLGSGLAFHFHTPEYRINEEYYPMDVHFVFENSDKAFAVVGLVFELPYFSNSTPLFDSVFAHIDDIATPGTYTKTDHLDFTALVAHLNSHGIYRYTGSLTTPPCSEKVAWFLSTEPLPLNVQS